MAEMVSTLQEISAARRKALVVPREHGAWGMLLVPLASGAAVGFLRGNNVASFVLLLVTALGLFWLRTPAESLMGTSPTRAQTIPERWLAAKFVLLLATVSAVALTALLWGGRNLVVLVIGGVALAAFGLQVLARSISRHYRMAAQMIGAAGLSATAPAAYYVVTGHFDQTAAGLWLANWIFAGDQIHYVQMTLHHSKVRGFVERLSRGLGFFFGQAMMFGAVFGACTAGVLPKFVILAFLPVVLRGAWFFFKKPAPLALVRLGVSELMHSISFGLLLFVSFAWKGWA
ncbi:MAG TPA: YwiC-like family protein [Candidatus Koribacter sp.]|jgi:hypothetical protein